MGNFSPLVVTVCLLCGGNAQPWTLVPGPQNSAMKHICFDGHSLCGTDAQDRIWVKIADGPWRMLSGELQQLIIKGAGIYGVNNMGQVYRGNIGEYNAGVWTRISGELREIHFDGFRLGRISHDGTVYFTSHFQNESPNWKRVPGKLNWLTFFGDTAYGLDAKEKLYIGSTSSDDPAWREIKTTRLVQVSFDWRRLAGINRKGEVWMVENDLKNITAKDWQRIGRSMKQVEIFNTHIYGVGLNDNIYYLPIGKAK